MRLWERRLALLAQLLGWNGTTGKGDYIRAAGAGRQERCHHVEVLQSHLGYDDRGDVNTGGTKRGTEEDASASFVG